MNRQFILFCLIASCVSASMASDMVVRGKILRHDSNKNVTTAEGDSYDGVATANWGDKNAPKQLTAKIIKAKMKDVSAKVPAENSSTKVNAENVSAAKTEAESKGFGQDIEWIEAEGNVKVTFPNRTMTANYCKSVEKKINCTGNVTIIAGKNKVSGESGSFDLENDHYEISSSPDSKQVEAMICKQ